MIGMWIFAAAGGRRVLGAAARHPALRRPRTASPSVAALEKPLMVLVPLAAVAVLVLVFLTGDAGARAVWQQG